MAKSARCKSIPAAMKATHDAILALTDDFCGEHLNPEYRDLARRMTAALCRKRPSPLASGQPRGWACGIIYELGQLNFLSDPATRPCMASADICAGFGVSPSTMHAKAKAVSTALDTSRMDPTWMLRSLIEQNPLIWMASVNGLLVDLRDMPQEVQEIASKKGIIPFIPAEPRE
ncbi:MAG TPA: DUF6398 domain-containing protein [Acetobacteraceae bacterium]|nr:DUF6398 domain-containing protein [Acetobacteraceae bacterium]